MHYLSIGCIFKNESHSLLEFIEHHLYHGVEHFFMINDCSTDGFWPILKPFVKSGKVTLLHMDNSSIPGNRQVKIYRKYFGGILNKTKWLAIIDLDEFIYSPNEIDIKNIIRKYEKYDQLNIDWVTYGSNQCYYQPFSIVSGFNKHFDISNPEQFQKLNSIKSIFKTEHVSKIGIHSSIMKKNNNREINISYQSGLNQLFINHYQLQSVDFYVNVKGTRGDVNNLFDRIGKKRDINLFNEYDINDIECNTLIEQNREIIKKVKDYKISKLVDRDITFILISNNNPELLNKTIKSFITFNNYPIKEFIIIDDSGIQNINDSILNNFPDKKIKLVYNKNKVGLLKSIDIAFEYITTKYVFYCEENIEFIKEGFIEKSFEILDSDPKIITKLLYSPKHLHPLFNTGLRRTYDILLFHPYTYYCQSDEDIDKKFKDLGYSPSLLDNINNYAIISSTSLVEIIPTS